MTRALKFPALPRRLPDALTVLSWCAVPAFAIVLLAASIAGDGRSLYLGRHFFQGLAAPLLMVAVAIVLALPIGWASRRPVPVLGVMLAEAIGVWVYGGRTWPLLLAATVLVFYVTITHSQRTAAAAGGSVLITWVIVNMVGAPLADLLSVFKLPSAFQVVVTIIAWILGSWIRLRQDHAETLRTQATTQAVQAERLRIARELHDMVAHSVGVIAIQAGAAARVIETQPAGAREALKAIELTSRDTLAGLRRMLIALREADADEAQTAPASGLADIEKLVAVAGDAGVHVDIRWGGEKRPLPAEIDLSAYRIIQESLTNVLRHAGAARCGINVDYLEDGLAIEVVDDGRGGASSSVGSGYGIVGMRERVALLHGQFSAGPRPEGGFRVAARLPA
ncbi:sensor histidine kinase [Kitasatospora sp. RB6PN24]|uniref:sensor histidine kinase n=1 Tax=Kitasatospora humi TaxID=2893891 RepID=UPI001E49CA4C|nr:sensor histidine kinase [Kitasatospora humi]MCC9312192.1 sensor histidine kinase [Kitasatospora humi]